MPATKPASGMNRIFASDEMGRLTRDEESTADFDSRLASVWPFLIGVTRKFVAGLPAREKTLIDVDDALSEIWLKLRQCEAAGKWEPSRGRYITFASAVASRKLCDLRDAALTVKGPANCRSKLRQYWIAEDTLSPRKYRTYRATIAACANPLPITPISSVQEETRHQCEEDDEVRRLLEVVMRRLTPYESVVVGYSVGLFGRKRLPMRRIAAKLRMTVEDCSLLLHEAQVKIRWHFENNQALDHPHDGGACESEDP